MPQKQLLIDKIRDRLSHPLPGMQAHSQMAGRALLPPAQWPDGHKVSAVLCLLVPGSSGWKVLLIRRVKDNGSHSGQIAFPGGRAEEDDASLLATALRETEEEVGIAAKDISILGALTPIYIPVSNYAVHPYLGFMAVEPQYIINHHEVDDIIEWPLHHLTDEKRKATTTVSTRAMPPRTLEVSIYKIDEHDFIWGATAMMLAELEAILVAANAFGKANGGA